MATSSFVAVFMPGMILPATSTRKRGGVFFYGAERWSSEVAEGGPLERLVRRPASTIHLGHRSQSTLITILPFALFSSIMVWASRSFPKWKLGPSLRLSSSDSTRDTYC